MLSRTRKGGAGRGRSAQEQRVITLEARLRHREAQAELMTEYGALKKDRLEKLSTGHRFAINRNNLAFLPIKKKT